MVKSEAIVLRVVDYSESSRIVTVLSRVHGIVALMARGARRPKSPFSGFLEPGQILNVLYSYKASRSVQTLSEAEFRQRLSRLGREMGHMALSMSFLELLVQLLHEEEVNEPVFDFAERVLVWMDRQKTIQPALFPYLQIRLASLTGLELQIADSPPTEDGGFLNIENGLVSTEAETDRARRLSAAQFSFVLNCCRSRKVSLLRTSLSPDELKDLIEVLDRYFHYHLGGLKPRRSDAIFEIILND